MTEVWHKKTSLKESETSEEIPQTDVWPPKKELEVLVDIPAQNHCLLQQLFFVDVIHKVRHTYLGFKSQII